ncbi:hypothetical protein CJ030_MR5G018741 [Morella rubra]|uniref:Uncharacterized protein n=1 Tax=Morella rubra TaxID=262757 RepID=A0A6A1VPP0_9ROSI|nr:hypothetical protein CJ030_MR5G018741 [Morella rubra]
MYLGVGESMTILEKKSGRMMEAIEPIMAENEWLTKMQESTCSSSKIASKSYAKPSSVEYRSKSKYSGFVVPATILDIIEDDTVLINEVRYKVLPHRLIGAKPVSKFYSMKELPLLGSSFCTFMGIHEQAAQKVCVSFHYDSFSCRVILIGTFSVPAVTPLVYRRTPVNHDWLG